MSIFRRLGLGICTAILGVALVGLAWSHVFNATVQDKDTVKGWLEDSGFYNRITDSFIEQAEKGAEDELPLQEPAVQAAIKDAFDADFLRSNMDQALDAMYAWVEGDVDQPQFTIDISDAKTRLIDGLGHYAEERTAELRACSVAETRKMSGEYDVLNADCRPAGVTPEQAGQQVRHELADDDDFLPDEQISSSDFWDNGDGGHRWPEGVRTAYQRSRWLPFILVAIAAAVTAGVILLSSTKRKGIIRVGGLYIFGGVAVGLTALFFSQGARWINLRNGDDNSLSAELAVDVFRRIGADVSGLLWWYAAGFVLLGALGIIFARFYNRSSNGAAPSNPMDPVPPVADAPSAEGSTPVPDKEKPRTKQPPKIQL